MRSRSREGRICRRGSAAARGPPRRHRCQCRGSARRLDRAPHRMVRRTPPTAQPPGLRPSILQQPSSLEILHLPSCLCPCVHHISPTSYLFHLLLSCAPYHRLPTACQPYIFFTTTPSLPVLALTSNPHSPPLPPSLPPSPPQFTRTLRGRCRAHRVRGECARAQLERPHPNVLRLKARPRGHRQDTCRCRCECQSASYPHYYSR